MSATALKNRLHCFVVAAVTAGAGCSSIVEPEVPTYMITAVTVEALDRFAVGKMVHYIVSDTLRGFQRHG